MVQVITYSVHLKRTGTPLGTPNQGDGTVPAGAMRWCKVIMYIQLIFEQDGDSTSLLLIKEMGQLLKEQKDGARSLHTIYI